MTFIKVKDGKNTFKVDYNRNKIAPFLSKCSSNSIIYIKVKLVNYYLDNS
jgi:hypothetical protein